MSVAIKFSNETERLTKEMLFNILNIEKYYEPQTYRIYLNHLNSANKTTFFKNVPSPYLTEKGNNKRTEMSLFIKDFGSIRIECKHLVKYSNLVSVVEYELNFVDEIPEDYYCLILMGEGFNNRIFQERLEYKIKTQVSKKIICGSISDFEHIIKNIIK